MTFLIHNNNNGVDAEIDFNQLLVIIKEDLVNYTIKEINATKLIRDIEKKYTDDFNQYVDTKKDLCNNECYESAPNREYEDLG